jgi:CheY-like chemotaxis protein
MILIVEDDVITRYSFAQLLRGNGHEVVESGDGNEALVFLHTLPIDLVITDLVLPNVNGLNLVTHIHRRWPNMPIVLVSGYLSQYGGETILGDRAHFFQKPVRPSVLVAAVRNLLPPTAH